MFNFGRPKTAGDWIVHIARGHRRDIPCRADAFGGSYCESVHSGSPTSGISFWRRCFAPFLASFPSFCCRPAWSNEKSLQHLPSLSTRTGWIACPVKEGMARAQKRHAETFECITRTSHEPGNRLHTSCAMQVPIPRLRYPRTTKNSAISQTLSFPHRSDPLFTKTNPTSLPATVTRNGCRSGSLQ